MIRSATGHDDGTATQRKATLFCWECDHTSTIDGDWQLQPRRTSLAYVCPDCETTLAERPRPNETAPPRVLSGPLGAWQRTLRASATVWRASIAAGLSSLTALTEFAAAGSQPHSEIQ